jgi:hypothetical protein
MDSRVRKVLLNPAAYARVVPLGYGSFSSTPIAIDGYEPQPNGQSTDELYNEVSSNYFATMDTETQDSAYCVFVPAV